MKKLSYVTIALLLIAIALQSYNLLHIREGKKV